jgi:hypothetical protein
MPYRSVPSRPFSDNDVAVLAELFEIPVNFFRTHQSPNAKDFIAALRTIAGLGFTAALVDDGGIIPYQTYFNRFIDVAQGDLVKHQNDHASLCGKTMANMVAMGLDGFRRINYPAYYMNFREAVKCSIQNVLIGQESKANEAERIMRLLPPPLVGRGGLLY